jgi:diaminopimelate epimerase
MVTERSVEVRMPGGSLHVEVRDDFALLLRGPVEGVYRGTLAEGMLARLGELSWG